MSRSVVHRALVVEDEPLVRNLTQRALQREGFECDSVQDGEEALSAVNSRSYDVVVTDLRMPNLHGHALAAELLRRQPRPVVVVLTAVTEIKLARDLYARGVEEVVFKPVDYMLFALRIRELVQRCKSADQPATHQARREIAPVDLEPLLAKISRLRPISQGAIDVFNVTMEGTASSQKVAKAVEREPSLVVEVLRMANSSIYNGSSDQRVESLEAAVTRIGQERVGEMALALSVFATLTQNSMRWLDVDLVWRRSLAAGVAVERIIDQSDIAPVVEPGVFAAALLHALGRVILASVLRREYEALIETCRVERAGLREQESKLFGINHCAAFAELLDRWQLPKELCLLLRHLCDDYQTLAALPEGVRRRIEHIKIAILVSRLAIGRWQPWDTVELPPRNVIRHHQIRELGQIIERTRCDATKLANSCGPAADGEPCYSVAQQVSAVRDIGYERLGRMGPDFGAAVLRSLGYELKHPSIMNQAGDVVVANSIGTSISRLVRGAGWPERIVFLGDASLKEAGNEAIRLPASVAQIQHALCPQQQ